MKLLFVLSILLILGAAAVQAAALCACPLDYRPVCGVNGGTYPNKCRLNCARVKIAHNGKC